MTTTKIGVPAGSGRSIAACAISLILNNGAAAPTATAPDVSLRNFRLVTVSIIVSYAFTKYSGLHKASKANCAGSDCAPRNALLVRGLHSATPNQSALCIMR